MDHMCLDYLKYVIMVNLADKFDEDKHRVRKIRARQTDRQREPKLSVVMLTPIIIPHISSMRALLFR